jgi:hypothetical protein
MAGEGRFRKSLFVSLFLREKAHRVIILDCRVSSSLEDKNLGELPEVDAGQRQGGTPHLTPDSGSLEAPFEDKNLGEPPEARDDRGEQGSGCGERDCRTLSQWA